MNIKFFQKSNLIGTLKYKIIIFKTYYDKEKTCNDKYFDIK